MLMPSSARLQCSRLPMRSTGDIAASDMAGTSHLLWLSARNGDALELLRQRSADWLEARPHVALIDFCASVNQGAFGLS